jgi:hypothetical protein
VSLRNPRPFTAGRMSTFRAYIGTPLFIFGNWELGMGNWAIINSFSPSAPCSLLPAPCSLLPAPCSLLPAPCSLPSSPFPLLSDLSAGGYECFPYLCKASTTVTVTGCHNLTRRYCFINICCKYRVELLPLF